MARNKKNCSQLFYGVESAVKVGHGLAEKAPPSARGGITVTAIVARTWSFSAQPPSSHPQQGLLLLSGSAWKAEGKGTWKMESLQYMVEPDQVGKGIEQKGKELGQTHC